MKHLIQYQYKVEETFFKYLRGQITLSEMISVLREIEAIEREGKDYDKDAGLWFRLFDGSTLATTIDDLEKDLNSPSNINYQYTKEHMWEGIGLNSRVLVYFS